MAPLVLATLQQLEHTQYWPPAMLRAQQFRQIDLLLAHTCRTMPWHAERMRKAGVIPGRPLDDAAWRDIPILTRRDVQDAGDAAFCPSPPQAHGAVSRESTSGSSGMPLQVRRTVMAKFFWDVFTVREELWHRRDIGSTFGAIRRDPQRPADHAGPWSRTLPDWGPPLAPLYPTGPSVLLDFRCTTAEQVAWLQQAQPAYLLGFAVTLHHIARYCLAHGITLPCLRGLKSSGEVLTDAARLECHTAFGVPVTDMYSAVETGYLALQCPEGDLYHAQSEGVLLEVLRPDGTPCEPGETGRVVVTVLHNFAMPLIRYAIGDEAEVAPPCPCGRTLLSLRRIVGRSHHMVRMPDGSRRFPEYGIKSLANYRAIIQHQLVQTEADALDMRIVARAPLTDAEAAALRATMQQSLGHPFRIAFTYHDALPLGPGGKFQQFRCDLPD